jgi:hypothetical protein
MCGETPGKSWYHVRGPRLRCDTGRFFQQLLMALRTTTAG